MTNQAWAGAELCKIRFGAEVTSLYIRFALISDDGHAATLGRIGPFPLFQDM